MHEPNNLLRAARLRRSSPSGSGRPMSRQEVADALNSVLLSQIGKECALDANYLGKLERGLIRWPNAAYRQALRTVFSVSTDAELGLSQLQNLDKAPKVTPKGGADLRRPQPFTQRR